MARVLIAPLCKGLARGAVLVGALAEVCGEEVNVI